MENGFHMVPESEMKRSLKWCKVWLAYSIFLSVLATFFASTWFYGHFRRGETWTYNPDRDVFVVLGTGEIIEPNEATMRYFTVTSQGKTVEWTKESLELGANMLKGLAQIKSVTIPNFELDLKTNILKVNTPPMGIGVSYCPGDGWEEVTLYWRNPINRPRAFQDALSPERMKQCLEHLNQTATNRDTGKGNNQS